MMMTIVQIYTGPHPWTARVALIAMVMDTQTQMVLGQSVTVLTHFRPSALSGLIKTLTAMVTMLQDSNLMHVWATLETPQWIDLDALTMMEMDIPTTMEYG
jgi:hypothetical protein